MKEIEKEEFPYNSIIFSICYCFISILIILLIDLWFIRVITIFFFFFFLGYPISLLIKKLDTFERIAVSFGLSNLLLLLIYYAYYISSYCLNLVPNFEVHLLLIGIFSVGSNLLLVHYFKSKNYSNFNNSLQRIKIFILNYKYLLIILIIGIILRFLFLNEPDFYLDETFFISPTYPIINPFQITGLPPPPFIYLSFHHPPLSFVGQNLIMNILNPYDWLAMKDWMAKFYFAFIGSISIFSIFSLLNKIYGKPAGYVGALFYSLNTFAIIVSRVGYQEILLILFFTITMDFMYRENWKLVGFFLGLSLLTKFTALTIIPPVLLYLLIRNFKLNRKSSRTLLINFNYIAIFAILLYLPVFIANMISFLEFGYADTFLSRVFGLRDPLTEVLGEAEIPAGLLPGIFKYSPLLSLELINIIGLTLIPYLIVCVFLSFLDNLKKLGFNFFTYSFFILFYLIFTSRWFQIITLSPLIIPITIISCRIVNLDKIFSKFNIFFNKVYPIISLKFKPFIKIIKKYTIKINVPRNFRFKSLKNTYKEHRIKYQHFIICSFLVTFFGFSFIYSWNTIAYPHCFLSFNFDDVTETLRSNTQYSTVGYLWITRNGYDEVMEIIRLFKYYWIYIDDTHPIFSYLFYFYGRGMTNLVSDWDNRTNALFVFYKQPNYLWEPHIYSDEGNVNEDYIKMNGRCIWDSLNFEIYII
ncbi:MAG: glycosyltransferase family 39 protein [Promethearchaeota archaeon]